MTGVSKKGRRRPRTDRDVELVDLADDGSFTVRAHDCSWRENVTSILEHLEALERDLESQVAHARGDHGATWAEVAGLLGMTRQGAQSKFRHLGSS